MDEEKDEKQHKPTAKRLEDMRKKGNFLRSRDLLSGLNLITALALLTFLWPLIRNMLLDGFTVAFRAAETPHNLVDGSRNLLFGMAARPLLVLIPMGLMLGLVAVLGTSLFGKFGFSRELIRFKAERINPLKNLKRIFSLQNAMEILKSLFKFLVFLGMLILFASSTFAELPHIHNVGEAFARLQDFLVLIALGAFLIMMVDMLYTWFSYQKKSKMSLQEVRDEQKETDGNPEIKKRVRAAQNAMSRQRISHAVPQATVVITNPTHYAVALRYRENRDLAPEILAMGTDHLAAQIRTLAVRHTIPVYQAPELARALYYSGNPGKAIHPDLYMPVALVLSWLVRLKLYQSGLGQMPEHIRDLQIPEAFRTMEPRKKL